MSWGSRVFRDSARRRRAPGSSLPGAELPGPGAAGPSWSSGLLWLAYSFLPRPEESNRSCTTRVSLELWCVI